MALLMLLRNNTVYAIEYRGFGEVEMFVNFALNTIFNWTLLCNKDNVGNYAYIL